jgi:protein gp37
MWARIEGDGPAWVIDIRKQCKKFRIPFFFKQWGGINKKKAGRELEGRTWDQMPGIDPFQKSGSLFSPLIIQSR